MKFLLLIGANAGVHEELAHWCASTEDKIAARLGYTRDFLSNMQVQGTGGKFTESYAALLSRNTRDQKLLVKTMDLCSWDQATQRTNRATEKVDSSSHAAPPRVVPETPAHAEPAPLALAQHAVKEKTASSVASSPSSHSAQVEIKDPTAKVEDPTAKVKAKDVGTAQTKNVAKVKPKDPDADLLDFMKAPVKDDAETVAAPAVAHASLPAHAVTPTLVTTMAAKAENPQKEGPTLDPDEALLDVMKGDDAATKQAGDAFVQTSSLTSPVDLTHVTLEDWMKGRPPHKVSLHTSTEEDDSVRHSR